MLEPFELAQLELKEREQYVCANGEYLTWRHHLGYTCAYYALHDYFAEITIDHRTDQTVAVMPFIEGDRLNSLLEAIELYGEEGLANSS